MPRSRILCTASAVLAAGTIAVLAQSSPAAAVTSTGSCVDGGGTRWAVRVVWGDDYPSGDITRVSLASAAWTTGARGPLATDSRVRTYDGAGTKLQDLTWSGPFDYAAGAVYKARNPVNPPSAPGQARVAVTLGVDGDGFGGCTVTLVQPPAPTGTSSPTPTPSPTPTAEPTASAGDLYEADVVTATNHERSTQSLPALTPQACVDSYAEAQAARMASEGRMYHQDLGPILSGCSLRSVGENVAYGYPDGTTVTAAWMASPGHRANILNASYRSLGVGAAQDSQGRWYACQVFGAAR
jgi:uncharacterized protein YkwD